MNKLPEHCSNENLWVILYDAVFRKIKNSNVSSVNTQLNFFTEIGLLLCYESVIGSKRFQKVTVGSHSFLQIFSVSSHPPSADYAIYVINFQKLFHIFYYVRSPWMHLIVSLVVTYAFHITVIFSQTIQFSTWTCELHVLMNRTHTNSTNTSPSGQQTAFWVVTANSENLILQESFPPPKFK